MEFDCFSGFFVYSWLIVWENGVIDEGGRRQGRRQEMLTQGLVPDPKCKLNISSFLKLLHPLGRLICAKDTMIIVLLLQMMGNWKGGREERGGGRRGGEGGEGGWGVLHLC